MTTTILTGDAVEMLRTLPAGVAQCCVTSPPYYGLRDYGVDGQIGLEDSPDAYVARLVDVFREVRRVLRDDGALWLNIGDSYARVAAKGGSGPGGKNSAAYGDAYTGHKGMGEAKDKDLLGIPWMTAFALRADGWFLRSAIIWHKPNPMPESVRDRPTNAYEMVFLFAKSVRYFYDADAISEGSSFQVPPSRKSSGTYSEGTGTRNDAGGHRSGGFVTGSTRNARNVWTITPKPYRGAHFATMPPDLAERCIKAGSAAGDTVLDPFGGAGTTAYAAQRVGRSAILCELNPAYVALARERLGLASADAAEGAAAARLALTAAIERLSA